MSNQKSIYQKQTEFQLKLVYVFIAVIILSYLSIIPSIFKANNDFIENEKAQIEICQNTHGKNFNKIKDKQCYNPITYEFKEIPKK